MSVHFNYILQQRAKSKMTRRKTDDMTSEGHERGLYPQHREHYMWKDGDSKKPTLEYREGWGGRWLHHGAEYVCHEPAWSSRVCCVHRDCSALRDPRQEAAPMQRNTWMSWFAYVGLLILLIAVGVCLLKLK